MSAFPESGRILFWKIILILQKLASTQLLSGDVSGILKRLFIRNLVHINFCVLQVMQISSPRWIVFRLKESLAKYKREVIRIELCLVSPNKNSARNNNLQETFSKLQQYH